ncbi:RecX family transcriptional regulator [bacterium]|nr:RecX family transcriptional regulator [bacterium]MCP5462939.1 RecX family transcriptional regulator [bacterium]
MKNNDSIQDAYFNECIKKAIRIISAHDTSVNALLKKLNQTYTLEQCKSTILFLQNNGYLNEEKCAFELGSVYIRKANKGPEFIRKALREKLFDETIVENTITRLFKETPEAVLALKCVQKKFSAAEKKFSGNTDNYYEKISVFLKVFLERNGFTQDICDKVVDEFIASHLDTL